MEKICNPIFIVMMMLFLQACGKAPKEKEEVVRPVKVFHVLGPEDVAERSFPGKIEASKKVELSFRVPGWLVQLPVKEGDVVEKGQLIAQIDPIDYEIAVGEAKSEDEFAQIQLERVRQLLAKEFASQMEYDAQKTAADVARAKLEVAEQHLGYTEIRAPFAGEIARRYVENYQNVTAKQSIVRLQNREEIEVEIQIPESIAIRGGQVRDPKIDVEFETAPGSRYQAKIKEIAAQADPETQTYAATLILPSPSDLNVLPGMTAIVHVKVQLEAGEAKTIFVIPASAVFSEAEGKTYVWVIEPSTNILKKQEVMIERLYGDDVVVTQGLLEGHNIVAAGVDFLHEGNQVFPLEEIGS